MTVEKVEIIISNILRIGVIVSLGVVLLGMLLVFIHHPDYLHNPQDLAQLTRWGGETPQSLHSLFAGVLALRGKAVIHLGLLLLILTPIVRVAASVFIFVVQKDRLYVILTLLALTFLATAFFLGAVT